MERRGQRHGSLVDAGATGSSNYDDLDELPGNFPTVANGGLSTDVVQFSSTSGSGYSTVGIDTNAIGVGGVSLGTINVTGSTALTITNAGTGASSTPNNLILNGTVLNMVANTLISATSGNLTIAPGSTGTPLGLRLGINNGVIVATSGTTITISSVISDGGSGFGFTFQGGGTLVLSGANTYTGGTTVGSGTVNINSNSALGGTGSGVVLNGGSLQFASGGGIAASAATARSRWAAERSTQIRPMTLSTASFPDRAQRTAT